MRRDIDQVIERLKQELPDVQVKQLQVVHPEADDDGVWFVRIPTRSEEVQIESSDGNCPFVIESIFSSKRFHADTIDRVVFLVRRLFLPG